MEVRGIAGGMTSGDTYLVMVVGSWVPPGSGCAAAGRFHAPMVRSVSRKIEPSPGSLLSRILFSACSPFSFIGQKLSKIKRAKLS
jgi:hypothetical protein